MRFAGAAMTVACFSLCGVACNGDTTTGDSGTVITDSDPPTDTDTDTDTTDADTTDPIVTFTAPLDGDTVSDQVTLAVDASDESGVAQVRFLVDNVQVDAADAEPWTGTWDASNISGSVTLSAVATDNAGNVASDTVRVTVEGTLASDALQIIYPGDGATVCGVLEVSAIAAVNLVEVDFSVDGTDFQTDTEVPWDADWDTSLALDGDHVIRALGTDEDGAQVQSSVTVTVDNDQEDCDNLPTVVIESPDDGAYLGDQVQVIVDARDDFGVVNVTLYVDSGQLAVDEAVPYKFDWDTSEFDAGLHELKAVAWDSDGGSSEHAIGVWIDHADPEIRWLDLADGDQLDGTVTLSADASDDLALADVVFTIDGIEIARFTETPFDHDWDTTLESWGSYTLTATATDKAGHSASDTLTVRVDNPPTVTLDSPVDGDTVFGPQTLSATVSDDDGLETLVFSVDGVAFDALTEPPWTLEWDVCNDGAGDHTIDVVATDGGGHIASDSAVVTVDMTETWYDGIDADCDGWSDYDADGDGYDSADYLGTDCDDTEATTYPGAEDTWYDGVDSDCAGNDDDDADADGEAAQSAGGTDCDDDDPAINTAAFEICDPDDVDEDCDTLSDDDDSGTLTSGMTVWYPDGDGDGYGDEDGPGSRQCDPDATYLVTDNTDCDDGDGAVNPGEDEICDADDTDENCNGLADDEDSSALPSTMTTWYVDNDGDGYGDIDNDTSTRCDAGDGYDVEDYTDCDDEQSGTNPGETEICDSLNTDEDCNGQADDDDPGVDSSTLTTFYKDLDGDNYGTTDSADLCDRTEDYSALFSTDCDDFNDEINPSETEICDDDDDDEDCDGFSDDDDSSVDLTTGARWYPDDDSDGYGDDSDAGNRQCDESSSYATTDNTDCDDTDGAISPSEIEVCDSDNTDEDCSGAADDNDSGVLSGSKTVWYPDDDGDDFGDASSSGQSQCDPGGGYLVEDATDCDDSDSTINTDGYEICDDDDDDEDCDGFSDDDDSGVDASTMSDWFIDNDGDGYGDPDKTSITQCDGSGLWTVTDNTDCDDSLSGVNPGETEVCDSSDRDEDCNGFADDDDGALDTSTTTAFYPDDDSDGYGDRNAAATDLCDATPGTPVTDNTDCNDTAFSTHPGSFEVWYDGVDSDCDGNSDYDADGDGYDSEDYSGDDCDDTRSQVNPGESETWYNGVDNDCDGGSDYDADSDGYDSDDYSGLDCDDTTDTVNPGVTETWYNGVDNDCDGLSDDDADLDGHDAETQGGDDCDDTDPFRNPTAAEAWFDGFDADCDGFDEYLDAEDADLVFSGANDNDQFGRPRGPIDLNGDGQHDLLVSGAGTARHGTHWAFYGPITGDLTSADADAVIEVVSGYGGSFRADPAGDTDGDGFDDLVIGGPNTSGGNSEAYLRLGPLSGVSDGNDDWAFVANAGTGFGQYLGYSVAGVGDTNGDGYDDILIGCPGLDWDCGTYAEAGAQDYTCGGAIMMLGPVTANHNFGNNGGDVNFIGTWSVPDTSLNDQVGIWVSGGGDLNGDGYTDLAIGASQRDDGGTDSGSIYLFHGPQTGSMGVTDSADITITGATKEDYFGTAHELDGDLNGDGYSDLIMATRYNDDGGTNAGTAWLIYGPITGDLDVEDSDAIFYGEQAGDEIGHYVAWAPNITSDGDDGILIGAAVEDTNAANAGAMYLILGTQTGTAVLNEINATKFPGMKENDSLVYPSSAGDLNGDGVWDFMFGAASADLSGSNEGAVYLKFGE
jgi:hypothetical protein